MHKQAILKSERLIFRPFNLEDVPQVQKLSGDKEIARTTLFIPHPYKKSDAENWIKTHEASFNESSSITYAIVLSETDELIGAISLKLTKIYDLAEIGYWIGTPFWGRGYCTEAVRAILKYGFEELKLNKIFAHHMTNNPASGRVMEKIGMECEGCCRQHVIIW